MLMKNILESEGSRRKSILSWQDGLGVPSMRYMGSPYMDQITTLVIISGTRVPFDSICYSLSDLESGYGRERGGCLSYVFVLVGKDTSVS